MEVQRMISKDIILRPGNAFQIFFLGSELFVGLLGRRAHLAWTRQAKREQKEQKYIWPIQGIFPFLNDFLLGGKKV